jgi:hypothetical protein
MVPSSRAPADAPPPPPPPQLYEPFYADFGPLNLGKTYRFCARTAELLEVRRVRERDGAAARGGGGGGRRRSGAR